MVINDGSLILLAPLNEPSGSPVFHNYAPSYANKPSGISFDLHVHITGNDTDLSAQASWPGTTSVFNISSGVTYQGYQVQGTSNLSLEDTSPNEKALILGHGGFSARMALAPPAVAQSGFTVGFWVNPQTNGAADIAGIQNSNELLAEHHALIAKSAANAGFILGVSGKLDEAAQFDGNPARFQLVAYAHVLQNALHLTTPIESGTYTHLTFSYRFIDGTSNQVVLYKDGRVTASGTTNTSLTRANTTYADRVLAIGASQTTTTLNDIYDHATGWGHLISGVYAYDRVLPEGEIFTIHEVGGLQPGDGIGIPEGKEIFLGDRKLVAYYPNISPSYIDVGSGHFNLISERDLGSTNGANEYVTVAPGPFGHIMPFISSSTTVALAAGSGLSRALIENRSFTIAGWFNMNTAGAPLISFGADAAVDNSNGFVVELEGTAPNNHIRVRIFNNGDSSSVTTLRSNINDPWNVTTSHVAFVYDDQTLGASLYVNGALAQSGTLPVSLINHIRGLATSGFPLVFCNDIPTVILTYDTATLNGVSEAVVMGRPLLASEINFLAQSGINITPLYYTTHDPRLRGYWTGSGLQPQGFNIVDSAMSMAGTAIPAHMTRIASDLEWDQVEASDTQSAFYKIDRFAITTDPILGFTSGSYVIMGGSKGYHEIGGEFTSERLTGSSDLSMRWIPIDAERDRRQPGQINELVWMFEVTPSGTIPRISDAGSTGREFNSLILEYGDDADRLFAFLTGVNSNQPGSGVAVVWESRDALDGNQTPLCSGNLVYGLPNRVLLRARALFPNTLTAAATQPIEFSIYVSGQRIQTRTITNALGRYYSDVDHQPWILQLGGRSASDTFSTHKTVFGGLGQIGVRNIGLLVGSFSENDILHLAASGISQSINLPGYINNPEQKRVDILHEGLVANWRFAGDTSGILDITGHGNHLRHLAREVAEKNLFATQSNAAHNLRYTPGPLKDSPIQHRASGISYANKTFGVTDAITPFAASGEAFNSPNNGFAVAFWFTQRAAVGAADAQFIMGFGNVPDAINDTAFNDSSWAIIIDDANSVKMLLSHNGTMPYDNTSTTASVTRCGFNRSATDENPNDVVELFKNGAIDAGHIDAWQHFAWSYNKNNNTIKAYLNGVMVDAKDVNPSGFHIPALVESRILSFLVPQTGVWGWGVNRASFNAYLTDVLYFNKPLNDNEVLYLSLNGLGAASGITSGIIGGYIQGTEIASGIIGGYINSIGITSGIIGGQVSGISGAIATIGGYIIGEQRFASGVFGGFISGVGDRPVNMHASFHLDADEWRGYEVLNYYTFKADESAHGGVYLESLRDRATCNNLIPFKKAFGKQLFVHGARGALGSGLLFDGISDAWWREKTILFGYSGVQRGWDATTVQQTLSNLAISEATFGIWINPDEITETRGIAAIGSGLTGANWTPALNLYKEGNTVVARVDHDDVELRATNVLTPGEWTHIAVTFDNDLSKLSNNLILYINGIPAMRKNRVNVLLDDQTTPMFILGTALSGLPGAFPDPHPALSYFKGAIAETFFMYGILGSGTPQAVESGLLNITRNAGFYDAITSSGVSITIQDAGLIGLWRLNNVEEDLLTFVDNSFGNHNMTFVGDGELPEIIAPGAQKDGTFGSGAFFKHNNAPGAAITTSTLRNADFTAWDAMQTDARFTFACWVMPTLTSLRNSTPPTNSMIFGRATDGLTSINDEWYLGMTPSTDHNREDNIRALLSDASTDRIVDIGFYPGFWSDLAFASTRENRMNTPQHIAVSVNANIAHYYFNGHLLGYRPIIAPINGASANDIFLFLGGIVDESSLPFVDTTGFSGIIKDAVIFNRPLSSLEIKALVRDGIPARQPDTASGVIGGYILGGDDPNITKPLSAEFIRDNLITYHKFLDFEDNSGYKDEAGALRIINVYAHPSSGLPTASIDIPVAIDTNPVSITPNTAVGIVYSPRAMITNTKTDYLGSISGTAAGYWESTPGHREFTLCFWYRPRGNAFDGNERGIIGLGEGAAATRFGIFHIQDDVSVFYGGGTGKTDSFNNVLQLNAWQFIAVVRTGSGIASSELPVDYVLNPAQTMFDYQYTTFYNHGIPQGSGTFVSGVNAVFAASRLSDAFIVGNAFENNAASSGVADIADFAEISFWKRPLSAAEIRGIMLSGISLNLPTLSESDEDLLFLYRMEEDGQLDRVNSSTSTLGTEVNLDLSVSGVGVSLSPHPNPPRLIGATSGVGNSFEQNTINLRNHGFNHKPWNRFASDPLGLGGLSGSFVYISDNDQSGVFDDKRSNFSFGGWFKILDTSQLNTSIFGRGANFQGPVHFRARGSSADVILEVQGVSQNNYPLSPPTEDVDGSTPSVETCECHLAYIFDNDASESRLYRDGILINAIRHQGGDTQAILAEGADGDFIIGHFPRMSSTNFSGILTDVFFMNRVLSKDEIRGIVVYGWEDHPVASSIIGGYVSGVDAGGTGVIGGYINGQGVASGIIGGYINGVIPISGTIGGYIQGMSNGSSFIGGYVSGILGVASGVVGGYILVSQLASGVIGSWLNAGLSGVLNFDATFKVSASNAANFDSSITIEKTTRADFDAQVVIFQEELPPGIQIIIPPTNVSGLVPPFGQYFIARASGLQGKGISHVRWVFGDLTPPVLSSESGSLLFPAFHVFTGSGYFIVTVEATDTDGVRNSDTVIVNCVSGIDPVWITLSGLPRGGFAPLPVQFDQKIESIPNGVTITANLLNYGDGTATSTLNSVHVYTEPGRYVPIWCIRDSRGVIWCDSLEDGIDVRNL